MRGVGPWVAVLLLSIFTLAGCGGGGGDESTAAPVETTEETTALTKDELISQGDGICAEVNAAVGTVGSTSSEAGGEAAQVAGLYGGMVERLKDLGAPSDDSAGYAEIIAAAESLAQAEDNVKLASEREEGEAPAEAEASSALDSFQSAASAFGFEDCAEAPAAPVPGGSVGEPGEEVVEEELEEVAPEEEPEAAPEEVPVEEEGAGGGAGVGGGTEGGGGGSGSGESGGVGPG